MNFVANNASVNVPQDALNLGAGEITKDERWSEPTKYNEPHTSLKRVLGCFVRVAGLVSWTVGRP